MMFLKKFSNGSSSYREYFFFLTFISYCKICFLCLLKSWIFHIFEYFISSSEIFLLTLVDSLITYIKNENFKDSL